MSNEKKVKVNSDLPFVDESIIIMLKGMYPSDITKVKSYEDLKFQQGRQDVIAKLEEISKSQKNNRRL